MKIEKRFSNNSNHYKRKNHCNYITVHQTGNTNNGANADMHARYINNGSSETWHYTVDDSKAIQHFRHSVQCWHAGDGQGEGNTQSIGVEMCVNSDGNYNKTIDNGAELIRKLMKQHNISIDNVVQHNHWSGKNCPQQLRNSKKGVSWGSFKKKIQGKKMKRKTPSNNNDDLDELVRKTKRGDFGNGAERKKALGNKYQQVQDIINGKTNSVDIDDLVNRTIKGEFGNGAERKKALGSNYDEVMKKVNAKLG